MSNLNERCEQILEILTKASGHTSLKDLARKTGVSRRSIYYDICTIHLSGGACSHGKQFLAEVEGNLASHYVVRVPELVVQYLDKPLPHPLLRSECDKFLT